jgi:hypothetical protein
LRAETFEKDHKKYLDALKKSISDEEGAYEQSSQIMFDLICISPECFERSQ